MRAYSAADEEALRARDLLKDWAGEGFVTEAQHQQMQQETVCELRRTNIFLRLVLFFFTLIIVAAAVGLFFFLFLDRAERETTGIFLIVCAAISYAAAEFAVSRARLYRYGIEEAFAICSVGLLWWGVYSALAGGSILYSSRQNGTEFLIPTACAVASLWIWHRFGLPYFSVLAMIFAALLPGFWTSSPAAQHVMVAALYVVSLLTLIRVRPQQRFTYLNERYSIAEAFLWLGIYLAINLQLSSLNLLGQWWLGAPITYGTANGVSGFSKSFYWATWVLIWFLPPVVLARGLRTKDRFVIAAGAIAAVLTLISNKPYLGWPRHTWDPMLFGSLLIGVALFIRHWLAKGPNEIRKGFTARRLSGKDKLWMNAAATALGLAAPSTITPSPQSPTPDVHFGGGDSGGGGASSDW